MAVLQSILDNGLEVILKPVRHVPIVSTWLWYRVGSRNEVEGLTGVSHWVEHMMFKGSPTFPKGSIMRAVDRHGGYVNAMTSHDFTAYYATLPSAVADLALQIEADRMTGALVRPRRGGRRAHGHHLGARGGRKRASVCAHRGDERRGVPRASLPSPDHRLERGPQRHYARRAVRPLSSALCAQQRRAGGRRRSRS